MTPLGVVPTHELESSTAELNALSDVTVHVLVPLPPCAILIEDGLHAMLKSGTTADVTCTVSVVLWDNAPLTPPIVMR